MIIRVAKKEAPYSIISNIPINDARLSLKARGLLLYLLSKPPDWKVRVQQLANIGPDGMTAIRTAIKELVAAGYMKQVVRRDNGAFREWDYEVYETPQRLSEQPRSQAGEMPKNTPFGENSKVEQMPKNTPFGENPHMGNPYTGNRTLLNTEKELNIEKYSFVEKSTEPESLLKPDESQVKPWDEMTKKEQERYLSEVGEALWEFWNSQPALMTHRTQGVRREMYRKLKPRLEEGRTLPEIKQAIATYAEVLNDPNCWVEYSWTLPEFLGRHDGGVIDRFLQPKEAFMRRKTKPSNVVNDRYDELREALAERMKGGQ